MRRKLKGWKVGILSEDLTNAGGSTIKAGEEVLYRRYKVYEKDIKWWTGKYEYHYLTDKTLVRMSELLIKK